MLQKDAHYIHSDKKLYIYFYHAFMIKSMNKKKGDIHSHQCRDFRFNLQMLFSIRTVYWKEFAKVFLSASKS